MMTTNQEKYVRLQKNWNFSYLIAVTVMSKKFVVGYTILAIFSVLR